MRFPQPHTSRAVIDNGHIINKLKPVLGFLAAAAFLNILLNVQITGKKASWSVPIHVISRNRGYLQPFLNRGDTPGLIPAQPLPHRGMQTFLPDFLLDFSTRPMY